ncbi:MAG: primosomal protein N' [Lachnospiraceae bacterium]
MSQKFADIIIDISHEAIDRTFQYKIPKELEEDIRIGTQVSIPFGRGNHLKKGYVVGISSHAVYEENKLKSIQSVNEAGVAIESSLIELAAFIKESYGSTMINALKTVMPIKEKVKGLTKKEVRLLVDINRVEDLLIMYEKKHMKGKLRLLQELKEDPLIPYSLVTGKLNIAASTLKAMEKEGVIAIEEEGYYRDVLGDTSLKEYEKKSDEIPNEEQQHAINEVINDFKNGRTGVYLLKGVTGSGKTLVYIEMIEKVLQMGKQAIVLIPEIALTYQTVKRFRKRFGDKVTIMNSRLSKGERYDQFEKAKKGEVSVMIGPRSALFTPFSNIGLIIIDEEHESTYKSENPPKYHAREVAKYRALQCGASLVLGSATPSIESYYKSLNGEYKLLTLTKRAKEDAALANTTVVDLREELKRGNKSIFSNTLQDMMKDRLEKKQQIMLFLNRRGHTGFISCRSCGYVFKCPHCDVSLTEHFSKTPKEKLVCHYCGYETKKPAACPVCNSKFIAGFGIGTQKIEEEVKEMFPEAKVLRMDMDTTKEKDAHEKILSQFADKEADILVGTQMIVKGHDFSNVTLVGVIAADLTLFDNDYKAAERTFDLLTQAAGRAGRGALKGDVVIQTYQPDHYCIEAAANQDYEAFYLEEKTYRSILEYPPFTHVLAIFMESQDELLVHDISCILKQMLDKYVEKHGGKESKQGEKLKKTRIIGPCDGTIAKVNDRYRRVIYIKNQDYGSLVTIKNSIETYMDRKEEWKKCYISFDFDPVHGY